MPISSYFISWLIFTSRVSISVHGIGGMQCDYITTIWLNRINALWSNLGGQSTLCSRENDRKMSLEYTKLYLRHINRHNFWTVGPILEIQRTKLLRIGFPVDLYNFYFPPLIYGAFGGRNEHISMTLIGEKKLFQWYDQMHASII